ncbi:type IV secretion protein VblB10 [Bartonella australis AUST/NH1]|uniref:Type IV secretion protein VblB10 n=1 Tax=Bartonella australis (strain Aust/NH1) TaxID=1094489 RepID=M1P509_BARAA|nr:type IV secretion system protein VirB10 [Bartonella australis]AGF74935.1 type IV secretion protein VblB10 [Bartonella australis AUST/NH1]
MINDNDEIITEDRGTINDGRKNTSTQPKTKAVVVLVIISFCGYMLWNILSANTTPETVEIPKQGEIGQSNGFIAPPPPPEPLVLATPSSTPPLGHVILPRPGEERNSKIEETDPLLDSARRAPVLAFSNNSHAETHGINENILPTIPQIPNKDAMSFASLLEPRQISGTKAQYIGNRNYIISMGTSIPCILETALNSDQPGFTSCVINRDILSDNGRVVLLDKGTQVVGEYRGGLHQGQARLFVLWTRAKTPNGVVVNLDSPATDNLGRAGFDGRVNQHWWQRFGSALLLSVVGDATKMLVDKIKNDNIQINGLSNAGKEAASIALENQINIPPTLEKHQGELVNIFVARDINFSSVYRLAVTERKNTIYKRAVFGNFYPNPSVLQK